MKVIANPNVVDTLKSLQIITADNVDQLAQLVRIKYCAASAWAMDDRTLVMFVGQDFWVYTLPDIMASPRQYTWLRSVQSQERVHNVAINVMAQIVAFQHPQHRSIFIHDLVTGEQLVTLLMPDGNGRFNNLVFSPDGQFLATSVGYHNESSYIWHTQTGYLLFEVPKQPKIAFNRSSTLLASAGSNKLCLWDLPTGVRTACFDYKDLQVTDVAFHPSDQTIAIVGETHEDDFRQPINRKGKPVRVLVIPKGIEVALDGKCETRSWRVAFSPNGGILLASKGDSWSSQNPIQVWHAQTYDERIALRDYPLNGAANPANRLIFSPAGTILAFDNGLASIVELWGIPGKVRTNSI